MPADTMDGLRQEIDEALAVVVPQIRGLEDLSKVSLSALTLDQVGAELGDHNRRRTLLERVISSLNSVDTAVVALVADGYPEMPKAEVEPAVFAELQEQLADVIAAVNEFEARALASSISISLGAPAEKST